MNIGINDLGSFHPIINKLGISTRKDITRPFGTPFIFISVTEIKNPMIIHMENAARFASHVSP
jgi:hypothetical protein